MTTDLEAVFRAVKRWARVLDTETVPVLEAFDRVSSRSLRASHHMPRSNISALDGFVLEGKGSTFFRVGTQEMDAPPMRLKEGQAVFVPTGAPLPRNGRFVMAEHVIEEGMEIRTRITGDERKEWEKGSWLRKGTLVVEKGQRITAAVMENLALAGMGTVEVYRRPRVAVMTTGDEIKSGTVPDSNRCLLAGLVQEDRGIVDHVPTAPDRVQDMAEALKATLSSDLLVITGGTAKGKKDITREALRWVGARFLVDKPRITPGKTMAFGLVGKTPFFLLPGNPKSIRTLYEMFVRPCLMYLCGVQGEGQQGRYGE